MRVLDVEEVTLFKVVEVFNQFWGFFEVHFFIIENFLDFFIFSIFYYLFKDFIELLGWGTWFSGKRTVGHYPFHPESFLHLFKPCLFPPLLFFDPFRGGQLIEEIFIAKRWRNGLFISGFECSERVNSNLSGLNDVMCTFISCSFANLFWTCFSNCYSIFFVSALYFS